MTHYDNSKETFRCEHGKVRGLTPACRFCEEGAALLRDGRHFVDGSPVECELSSSSCADRETRIAAGEDAAGTATGSATDLDVEAMAHTLARAFGKESRHNPAWVLHNWHALCGISVPHHVEDCRRFALKDDVARLSLQLHEAQQERDGYKRAFDEELSGAGVLRKQFGARDSESFAAFVERLSVAESSLSSQLALLRAGDEPGVWPCGCQARVDALGVPTPLENDARCEYHLGLSSQLAAVREVRDELVRILDVAKAELELSREHESAFSSQLHEAQTEIGRLRASVVSGSEQELLIALRGLYALIPDCDGDYFLDGNKGKVVRVPGIGAACMKARAAISKSQEKVVAERLAATDEEDCSCCGGNPCWCIPRAIDGERT